MVCACLAPRFLVDDLRCGAADDPVVTRTGVVVGDIDGVGSFRYGRWLSDKNKPNTCHWRVECPVESFIKIRGLRFQFLDTRWYLAPNASNYLRLNQQDYFLQSGTIGTLWIRNNTLAVEQYTIPTYSCCGGGSAGFQFSYECVSAYKARFVASETCPTGEPLMFRGLNGTFSSRSSSTQYMAYDGESTCRWALQCPVMMHLTIVAYLSLTNPPAQVALRDGNGMIVFSTANVSSFFGLSVTLQVNTSTATFDFQAPYHTYAIATLTYTCRATFAPVVCTDAAYCSGNGAASGASASSCACECAVGWDGPRCDRCAEGYDSASDPPCSVPVNYTALALLDPELDRPYCSRDWQCSGNGNAMRVNATACVCACDSPFAGPRCERCAPGYDPLLGCGKAETNSASASASLTTQHDEESQPSRTASISRTGGHTAPANVSAPATTAAAPRSTTTVPPRSTVETAHAPNATTTPPPAPVTLAPQDHSVTLSVDRAPTAPANGAPVSALTVRFEPSAPAAATGAAQAATVLAAVAFPSLASQPARFGAVLGLTQCAYDPDEPSYVEHPVQLGFVFDGSLEGRTAGAVLGSTLLVLVASVAAAAWAYRATPPASTGAETRHDARTASSMLRQIVVAAVAVLPAYLAPNVVSAAAGPLYNAAPYALAFAIPSVTCVGVCIAHLAVVTRQLGVAGGDAAKLAHSPYFAMADGTRPSPHAAVRYAYFVDVFTALCFSALSNLSPGSDTACLAAALAATTLAAGYCVYMAVMRPLECRWELGFGIVIAFAQLGLAAGAVLILRGGSRAPFDGMTYAMLGLFFLQSPVLVVVEARRSPRCGGAPQAGKDDAHGAAAGEAGELEEGLLNAPTIIATPLVEPSTAAPSCGPPSGARAAHIVYPLNATAQAIDVTPL
jgi:hypothetical protein